MIVAPEQAVWYAFTHSAIALACALEPAAVRLPVAQSVLLPVLPVAEGEASLSLPQAVTPTASAADTSMTLVSGTDGSGTLVASLVDNDQVNDDALKGVAGAGRDSSLTAKIAGDTTIPAGGLLNLATQSNVGVTGQRVVPGNFVTITFSFDRAGAVTLDVPVESSDNPDYAKVPLPSGS